WACLTDDDYYIVAGYWGPWGGLESDIHVIKIDSLGNTIWADTYGGTGSENISDGLKTPDNEIILIGLTSSFGAGENDAYILKIDTNGDTLWTKAYGLGDWDYGLSICPTLDNNYLILCDFYYLDCESSQLTLIKIDENGDSLWSRRYEAFAGIGRSIIPTSDGGYIFGGYSNNPGYLDDYWFVRTDANGDTLWMKTVGHGDDQRGYSV
ncbi:MAG: hypothetical protein GY839_20145, partial [candidate division Zixibacteria bacterium]|nr:hypothetical protein [candidate division Zixibacteria bacterium]